MGYGISFGEPTIHLESMCGSSSSNPSAILEEIRNCTHFGEGCGSSSEISARISEGVIQDSNDLAKPDAAWFSEEKAGPSAEIALENALLEADVCGASKEKSGMVEPVTHAISSCTDTDSTMVALEKDTPIDVPGIVSSGVNEVLLPPLVNGSGISIAYTECVNASTGIDVAAVLKDDSSLEGTFSSVPSIVGCNSSGLETTGIKMESSANADKVVDSIIVSEDNVGMTQAADSDPPGVVLPGANPVNKEESSQVEGTNTSIGELHCNDDNVAMENTHKERERKTKPQEFIVFTRRNPKRSATHAESDLNIDRLTRISNHSRRTKKDKETFDSTPLVSLIRDPNLITNKRKPLSRRYRDSKWGDIVNLAQTVDRSLEFCKLKQEREAEEKTRQTALKEKMGKNKISNQSMADVKHLKQEVILDRDMDSTVTHEVSSVGHETVQRGTNERDAADPGSSPDSVVYNPLSCEANPMLLQQKQSPKNKKNKKNKGENAKPSRRDGLVNVSGNANQGMLYWFQKPNSKGKNEDKGQDLGAPGVVIKEKGNKPDPYNGVTIASVSGFAFDGTQEDFRHEGFLAQLLPPAKPLVPMHLVSTPVASDSVPVPLPRPSVPVTSNTKSIPGQPAMVPELPGQVPSMYLQPISSSLRSFQVPSPAAASGKPLQGKAQPASAPLQLVHAPAQNIPASAKPSPKQRLAWVCCDECEKWRCIPAELADLIDETNCRWTCKDNADKAFADCSIPQEKSNAEINAELEISDGSGDEGSSGQRDKLGDVNHMKPLVGNLKPHSAKSAKKALGPAPFTHLKTNLFLHRHRRSQTIDEIMVCNCKPPENGGMGCRSQCLNRMLNIECIKGMCPCGELCSNQKFQRRSYAKLMHFRSGKKGYGLQLLEDVPSGRFLIEYVGEVLDMATYEARQKEYASRGQKHFYFMTLNGGEVIDACAKGNMGRFINHSCDPNCRTEKWIVNGEVCIGLFAIRDIKKGEELTFDYNYVRVVGAAAKKCFCGAANCRGYIGGDPSSTDIVVQEDSDEEDYFEPIKPKQQQVATLLDNSLRKQLQADKSQNIFGMSAPVVQKGKSGCKERLEGCKPTSAVSRLASSLVNEPMHESKIRDNSMRLKTDVVFIKPSDTQGTSGSVNDGGLSQAIISSGSTLEISKPDYRDDLSWRKPDSLLRLPESYHEVCKPFDKEAVKTRDIKDLSQPSSSSIAVSSYSLLDMHLSRVNSLGEFKMGNVDQPSDAKLHINFVNECKPLEKESSLQGPSEKALLPNNSYEESELVDGNKLFQPLPEHAILKTNSYDTTENREVDDVSTPVHPDHQEDMDPDNLCEFACVPGSSSDSYAQASLPVPEHLRSPTRDAPSEEDTPHTPVHVTRYMSDRVHSSQSGDMGYKARSDNDPYDSDLQTEHIDICLTNPARHGQSTSPPAGSSGMKNVRTGVSDDDVAICQDVKEMAQYTGTPDFEGVEEKLNKLLDEDGSISRRKHAIKGYLKLLIVTAAAGDTGTVQRLRDLLLILDALLKTSSYIVLMNIMKTNGLQMLHTILKQNRDDYNRIPIIRKLLKVLGHLAEMRILTLEQMNQGPPRPGMESFRESIYKLTRHGNKKVEQIAREFFHKWMPKSMRVRDSFSHNCNPSTSKRKSRWDQPSDSHGQNRRFPSNKSQAQNLERPTKRPHSKNPEEDAPPGFEHVGPPPGFESISPSSFGSVLQPALGPCSNVVQVALGFRQERYRPGVSVSYGIPAVTAQTLGLLAQSEGSISWGIAPSIPFKPFPPVPPYPMNGDNNVQNNGLGFHNDRPKRRWNSNLKNQRFPRTWNNYEYARKNSNSQRSRKDWPKRPRDRR